MFPVTYSTVALQGYHVRELEVSITILFKQLRQKKKKSATYISPDKTRLKKPQHLTIEIEIHSCGESYIYAEFF